MEPLQASHRFKDAFARFASLDTSAQVAHAAAAAAASKQGSEHEAIELPQSALHQDTRQEVHSALVVVFKHLAFHAAKVDQIPTAVSNLGVDDASLTVLGDEWAKQGTALIAASKKLALGTPWICTDVGSQLSICLGSDAAAKASDMAGMLRLQLRQGAQEGAPEKQIITQMGQEELYQLLVQLDKVQQQLDALSG